MKRLRPNPRNASLAVLALVATVLHAALTPTEWPNRQTVTVAAPGLTQLAPPAQTFDVAQMSLADLRLLDPNGQEVAYLLDRDLSLRGPERAPAFAPKSFRSSSSGDTTQLLIETGTGSSLEAVDLETAVPYFLKAAHVDVSDDGSAWTSIGAAEPIFRQFGAEHLRLRLPGKSAAFIRVTLDDFKSRTIAVTGAKLRPVPVTPVPELVPVGATITRRDEFAGETVLTVTLDGKNVPLGELALVAKDPLFMRRVTIAVREVRDTISGERVVASGTVYRLALEGSPAQSQLAIPLTFTPATRELLVHIHNGDSPPLTLDGVTARQSPVNLFFFAAAAGNYQLLSGNAQAAAPRYDLAAFAGNLRSATAAAVTAGSLEAMPNYHARESLAEAPLPDIPLTGAPLDAKDWPARRALTIAKTGVQELELDPAALALSRADGGDLRLLRGGNQIPYVLERPTLARALSLTPVATRDTKRPTVSVWRVQLPQPGMPLQRIALSSPTPLFQRQFRIYEKVPGADGGTVERTVASGAWSRTPEPGIAETRLFELSDRLRSDALWIESDNGDNPAIALGPVQAAYPVVRLIFKVAETDGFTLAYGNPTASAPRYDLSLVAMKLLTATRQGVQLDVAPATPADATGRFAGVKVGYLFWGALALVVVVLLVVVAKLLPKPPAG
ncbi:MAG TPA: DUF3999 family protein [Lacunisphaera sp.]